VVAQLLESIRDGGGIPAGGHGVGPQVHGESWEGREPLSRKRVEASAKQRACGAIMPEGASDAVLTASRCCCSCASTLLLLLLLTVEQENLRRP
jgi:hypothetical protein